MKYTNQDLLNLFKQLQNAEILIKNDNVKSTHLSYAINTNKDRITPLVTFIQNELKNEELNKFNTEREDICKKYAKKNEAGEFIITTTNNADTYTIEDEHKPSFDAEILAIQSKYKSVIEDFQKKIEELEKFLLEYNTEISLYYIDIDKIPADFSIDIMTLTSKIIK